MKRTILLFSLLCFLGSLCFAKDAWLGKWELVNSTYSGPLDVHIEHDASGKGQLAVSQPGPSVPVEVSILYEPTENDKVRVIIDGLTANNQVVNAHYEWTGKFDGNDYPVVGDPTAGTRSYTKIAQNRFELLIKKDGNLTPNGRVALLFSGKKCTVTIGAITAVYKRGKQ